MIGRRYGCIILVILGVLVLGISDTFSAKLDDLDSDGKLDSDDNCPSVPNYTLLGTCVASKGTSTCLQDSDCRSINPFAWCSNNQEDQDKDGVGDVCDSCPNMDDALPDNDGDCVSDSVDDCDLDPEKSSPGFCGCGNPETDSDADGTPDCVDDCPSDSDKIEPGVCGCGNPETDSDEDGTPDCNDGCPDDSSKTSQGTCGCGHVDLADGLCTLSFSLPDTGQQDCYDGTAAIAPCPAEGEAYYGQDANYQIDVPRYTKLDFEGVVLPDFATTWSMVRDNVTGLVWQAKLGVTGNGTDYGDLQDPDNTYPWCNGMSYTGSTCTYDYVVADNTVEYIHRLNTTNYGDNLKLFYTGGDRVWRLPTVEELGTILQSIETTPLFHPFFAHLPVGSYWAADTDARDASKAWSADVGTIGEWGDISTMFKGSSNYVLAVSEESRQVSDRFITNMDGTVTDRSTGLMWTVEPADSDNNGLADNKTFVEALAWAESLDLAGYDDWRLPNRNELQSLVDYSRASPAIDTAYFQGIHDDSTNTSLNYWSSTTTAVGGSSIQGATVEFSSGKTESNFKGQSYNVRAVRGGSTFDPGSITIAVPSPGATVNYNGLWNSAIEIQWNPGKVPASEEVYIYFSSDGGAHYDLISEHEEVVFPYVITIETVPNNGAFAWVPSGEDSSNCIIAIVPSDVKYQHLGSSTGLFSIRKLEHTYRVSYQYWPAKDDTQVDRYKVSLEASHRDGIFTEWALWESPIAYGTLVGAIEYDTGLLTSANNLNGWMRIVTDFYGVAPANQFYTYLFFAPDSASAISESDDLILGENDHANDTGDDADTMIEEQFYRGDLNLVDDVDFFTFNLGADSIVNIGFLYKNYNCDSGPCTSVPADTRVEIISGATGDIVSEGTVSQHEIFALGLPAGQHFIRISEGGLFPAYNEYLVSYKVDTHQAYQENSATPTGLTVLPQQTALPGTEGIVNNLEDTAIYSFTISESAHIEVRFSPSSESATYLIEVRNSHDQIVYSIESTTGLPVVLAGIYATGDYTVEVTALGEVDAHNPYYISVHESEINLELEPNETPDTATLLEKSVPIHGRTASSTDVDFYSFTLDVPRYLNLSLFSPGSAKDYSMSLYKGSVLNQIDGISSSGGDNISLHMGLSVGTYYLRVTANGPAETVQYYTLLLQDSMRSNLEIESNNTRLVANTIEESLSRTGRIYSNRDIDYFGFGLLPSGTAGDIEVTFKSYSPTGSYRVSIVDVNQSEYDPQVSSAGSDLTLAASVPIGNYYIKIEPDGTVDPYTHYEVQVQVTDGITTLTGINPIAAVEISGDHDEMTPADPTTGSQTLIATAYYSNAAAGSHLSASFDWQSSDPSVATVDGSGVVTALSAGTVTILAFHPDNPDVRGTFSLVVTGADPKDKLRGNLVLVSGGGPDELDNLYKSTKYVSELVYARFRSRLFGDDDIYFLSPTGDHDIDGDGFNDEIVDDPAHDPTLAKFSAAISTWATHQDRNSDGPLYIYLVDHGGTDNFKLNQTEFLTAQTLKILVDNFQVATGRKVVVVIEACKSGTFVSGETDNNLVDTIQNRVVVTSTDELDTYMELDGRVSFSQFFLDRLLTGNTIHEAFDIAVGQLATIGEPYSIMAPQIELSPGADADELILGGPFGIGSLFPEFLSVSQGVRNITANSLQTFSAEIADLDAVERVWALVKGPDYQIPQLSGEFESPDVEQEVVNFQSAGLVHAGSSSNFVYNGDYTVTCYAMNANGNVSIAPQPLTLKVTGGEYMAGDVNGDSFIDLKDALLALQACSSSGTGGVVADYANSGADVDNDNQLGLAEAIMVLNRLAQ